MNDKAIVQANERDWLSPATSVENMVNVYKQMAEFVGKVLTEGLDYGTIPGTTKPTLYKPGAEKLSRFFGLRTTFDDVDIIEDWTGQDHGGEPFFYYRQRCNLWRGDWKIADAEGSCNSWEKKYRYRQAERICPRCEQSTIKRSKYAPRGRPNDEPGWYCFTKIGGCGAEFAADDESIIGQQAGLVANPDSADVANTVLKMAQKRAFVAATLIAVNGSEYFTQDVEDLSFGGDGEIVQGEVTEIEQPTGQKPAPRQSKKNGNGKPDPKLQALIDASVASDIADAAGVLNLMKPSPDELSDVDGIVAWGKKYRSYRDEGETPEKAAELANRATKRDK